MANIYVYMVECRHESEFEMRYVGITTCRPSYRWKRHCYSTHSILGKAIHRLGREWFIFRIVAVCDTWQEAQQLESLLSVDTLYPKGYNHCIGGAYNGFGGSKHTAETKAKISKALKGKFKPPISDETRRRLSESHILAWRKRRMNSYV